METAPARDGPPASVGGRMGGEKVEAPAPDIEGGHPEFLANETPYYIAHVFNYGLGFLQSYGWHLLFVLMLFYYLKFRFEKYYEEYRRRKQEQDYLNADPTVARHRVESMESARRRLQEQYDAQAARHAEEMEKREEEKRQERIEDWDRHQKGGGYRSKLYKPQESGAASGQTSSSSQPKQKKTVYRNIDYMPLGGGASGADSSAWRPGRRGGARGG